MMKNVFEVTDHGLQVDKVSILPGSTLILSRAAPGHWARFGESGQAEEKKMVVASPDGSNDGQPNKTKKRLGLEDQAGKLEIEFSDETPDDDLIAAIKAKKAADK